MQNQSTVFLYIDEDPKPIGEFKVPVNFEFDTTKLVDGEHNLKIVSKGFLGREGIRKINFTVRNGPSIAVEGIDDNAIVDGTIPLMVNAYSKGDQKKFLIEGSETPRSIPAWLWILMILFAGWTIYYFITSLNMSLY